MLRQLLSAPGAEDSLGGASGKPEPVNYAARQPAAYYPYQGPPAVVDYNGNPYGGLPPPGTPYAYAQAAPMEFVAPTSTSELYSSTYAMLSADGVPLQTEWNPYPPKPEYYEPPFPPPPHSYHQPAPSYVEPGTYYYQPVPQPSYLYDQTAPSTSSEPDATAFDFKAPNQTLSGRAAQAAFSESFRKVAHIPSGTAADEDEERVMCIACKGVYPSRRSLTGHIGRSEKCREVIGRTYLDTLGQPSQPGQPGEAHQELSVSEGGINPVCPHCDRFISHYKGNIRRHVNQCAKRGPNSKGPSPATVSSVAQHYASMAPVVTRDNPAYHHLMPDAGDFEPQPPSTYSPYPGLETVQLPQAVANPPPVSSSATAATPVPAAGPLGVPAGSKKNGASANGTGKPSSVAVPATNPYSCSWCKFTTVYKGNMKRHLISVHNCTDELLRRISFDLERLRLLSGDRPVTPLAPQPDRIRGCSGRRRRCRPKGEKSDSKKMKLLGEDEVPPAAVCDVVASFASPTACSVAPVVPEPAATTEAVSVAVPVSVSVAITDESTVNSHDSHDSGISSGSSIDDC